MAVEVARTTVQTRVVAAKKQERVFACPYVRATRLDSRTVVPFPTSRLLGEREGEGRIYTRI